MQTIWWPIVSSFKSWMVEDTLFCSSMAKIKLSQELDGKNGLFPYLFDICLCLSKLWLVWDTFKMKIDTPVLFFIYLYMIYISEHASCVCTYVSIIYVKNDGNI
jgi:hypothetical protein